MNIFTTIIDRQIQFSFINGNYYVNKQKKLKRVYNFITTMAELAVIITNWLELFRNSKMIITICDDLLILSECANQFFSFEHFLNFLNNFCTFF